MATNYGTFKMITKDGTVFADKVRELLHLMPNSEILAVYEYNYTTRKYRPNTSALEWLCEKRGQDLPETPSRPAKSAAPAPAPVVADVDPEPSEACAYYSYLDAHKPVIDKYLPFMGEGDTKASQIVTAVHKLFYKWYNDLDVYDTTCLPGGYNDLSSYANWLDRHTTQEASEILSGVLSCRSIGEYEHLLTRLADVLLDESYIESQAAAAKVGTIFECNGQYSCA